MAYDKLSELINDDLRAALRAIDFSSLPREKNGQKLVGLSNDHFSSSELILPELPAKAVIPHKYEGCWRQPIPGLSAEPTRTSPISDDPVLVRFGNCAAIYA